MSTPAAPALASILAIGTEITTGQITNRNAAWISERLTDLGIEVVLHETVADDRPRMREALDRCARVGSLVFVTGGLGPTTDDFTRDVIAEWAGAPLEFRADAWTRIEARLTGLGVPVAPSNRQQSYFPRAARVIRNEQGTADAFALDVARGDAAAACGVWVLPGPPREVAAVWTEIESQLRARVPQTRARSRLLTWQCLGKSEAELGEITERALSGSGLLTGYRAHRPFVEIKVWCPEPEMAEKRPWLDALARAIAPWIFTVQGEDLGAGLLHAVAARRCPLRVIDAMTGGALASRLARARSGTAAELALTVVTEWFAQPGGDPEAAVRAALDRADTGSLTLAIAGIDATGGWCAGRRGPDMTESIRKFASPYAGRSVTSPEMRERLRALAVEVAIQYWLGELGGAPGTAGVNSGP